MVKIILFTMHAHLEHNINVPIDNKYTTTVIARQLYKRTT